MMSEVSPPSTACTKIFRAPEDWSVQPLRSCLRSAPRYGINAAAVSFDANLPTYLRITDISDDNRFKPSPRVSVRHPDAGKYYLNEGDVVFARTGASVGKSYLYKPSDGALVFAGFLICITPDASKLEPAFLAYFAQSKEYMNWVSVTSIRSGQPGINGEEYGEMKILLPSCSEQCAIVETLSDVDRLLGALESLIIKKRVVKSATMQQLISGAMRLPRFRGTWTATRFGKFASIRNHKVLPSNVSPETLCVELDHIKAGSGTLQVYSNVQCFGSMKYRFCRGDVLFGRLRPYLRKYWHADRSGICTTEIWPLMVDPDQADSRFLYAIVQSDQFIQAAGISYGTHMPRADWNVMHNLEFCLPPVVEQQAIASVFLTMDAEIAALEKRRDKVRAIKQGMMQQLLTGRIRLPLPTKPIDEEEVP